MCSSEKDSLSLGPIGRYEELIFFFNKSINRANVAVEAPEALSIHFVPRGRGFRGKTTESSQPPDARSILEEQRLP